MGGQYTHCLVCKTHKLRESDHLESQICGRPRIVCGKVADSFAKGRCMRHERMPRGHQIVELLLDDDVELIELLSLAHLSKTVLEQICLRSRRQDELLELAPVYLRGVDRIHVLLRRYLLRMGLAPPVRSCSQLCVFAPLVVSVIYGGYHRIV